jgi:hypothetical protein
VGGVWFAQVANFLGVAGLLDALCRFVAEKIAAMEPTEIYDYFGIRKDATPRQQAHLIRTHKWIDPEGSLTQEIDKTGAIFARLAHEAALVEAVKEASAALTKASTALDEANDAEKRARVQGPVAVAAAALVVATAETAVAEAATNERNATQTAENAKTRGERLGQLGEFVDNGDGGV